MSINLETPQSLSWDLRSGSLAFLGPDKPPSVGPPRASTRPASEPPPNSNHQALHFWAEIFRTRPGSNLMQGPQGWSGNVGVLSNSFRVI